MILIAIGVAATVIAMMVLVEILVVAMTAIVYLLFVLETIVIVIVVGIFLSNLAVVRRVLVLCFVISSRESSSLRSS